MTAEPSVTHERAETRRRQRRALGAVAVIVVGAAALTSAMGLVANGRGAWSLGILVLGGLFVTRAWAWRDVAAERREAVSLSVVAGLIGALLVSEAGVVSGLPFLLLPAVFLGGFDFGHWRDDVSIRVLVTRSSRLTGSLAVLGVSYVGAFALIDHHHPLAGAIELLVAPWLYLMPAVTIFLASWHDLSAEARQVTRGRVAMEIDDRLHSLIEPATRAIRDVHQELTELGADEGLLDRLEAAAGRSDSAQVRALIWKGYDPDVPKALPELSFLSGRIRSPRRPSGHVSGLRRVISAPRAATALTMTTIRSRAGEIAAGWKALHKQQIEWVTLFATLWLRAAIVIAAPALSHVSWSPVLPGSYRDVGVRAIIWWIAAAWAGATALAAPKLVPALLIRRDERLRRSLLVIELPILGALLIGNPSWPTAAFAAGILNWAQRPQWTRLRFVVAAVTLGTVFGIGCAIHWAGWSIPSLIAELFIGAAVLTVISCSYGLMAPLLLRVTMLLPIELSLNREWDRQQIHDFAVRQSGQAAADAERLLIPALAEYPDSDPLRRSAERLSDARIRLTDPDALDERSGRAKVLGKVLTATLTKVLPPEGVDPDAHVHAFEPKIDPPQLARARLQRDCEKALRKAVAEIAREADDHGVGRLRTSVVLGEDRVAIAMANEVGPPRAKGRRRGEELIDRAVSRLPDGRLESRQVEEGTRFFGDSSAFVVRFSFATSAFARLPRAVTKR